MLHPPMKNSFFVGTNKIAALIEKGQFEKSVDKNEFAIHFKIAYTEYQIAKTKFVFPI